jgi:NitT/TauT family transport system substrate-binding protein
LLLAIVGCREPVPTTTIDVALNWFPDAQHAGFYGATKWVQFSDPKYELRIVPGGPAAPIVQNVALKRSTFGVASADQILLARGQGTPIVAVMASMQTSPRCIMVHRERAPASLRDLRDCTLALGAGQAFAAFLRHHAPLENVQVVPYTGSIAPFLADPQFAQQAYTLSEPFLARQQGADPVCLLVSELGYDPYASCLFTHEETVRAEPELVRQVVRAVRLGWLDYFRDAASIHGRIVRDNRQQNLESLEFGRQAVHPLCLPAGMSPTRLGTMDAERWRELTNQLIELKLLPPDTEADRAHTEQFLEDLDISVLDRAGEGSESQGESSQAGA